MVNIDVNREEKEASLVKSILNDTLKDIMSILKAERGSLFLFDGQTGELVLDSFLNGTSDPHPQGIKYKVGEGISGKVLGIKEPVLVKDINSDLRFIRNGFKHYQTNSFISIPLFDSDELLGVINIADKSTGEPFSEKDLKFTVTLCRYACSILDNLLHLEALKNEKKFQEKQKLILEKYASVGKLTSGIVHEVNSPLDGIMRYTNILINQMENNTVAKTFLLEIKKGLNHISGVTKSLLEFSHHVNSGYPKIKKYVDLHLLLEECLETLSERINGNITIEKKFNPAVPKIKDIGLSHVFLNIVKNALDAMPQGGTLAILTEMKDSMVEIKFKDSGSGIPNEIREHIFEPFFTTKSKDKGTGLGLAICKEIVNKYEGQIEVESSQGNGSIFRILIPNKYLENGG